MHKYICLIISLLVGCTSFPTRYDRIEADKVRLIDFIYEPAEAAPGDTVTVKALFAGKDVTPEDISWKISLKVLKNIYGMDTALEVSPLKQRPVQCFYSDSTSCISFQVIIPENIMRKSPMIPENPLSLLPPELKNQVPDMLSRFKKDQLLDMVELIGAQVKNADENTLRQITDEYDSLIEMLPPLLQYLTVQIRIFAGISSWHKIQSDYSVRYNSIFARLPEAGIHVNTNPVIDSIGIYKVKGKGKISFDEKKHQYEFFRLYGPLDEVDSIQEIPVDTNAFSYFIAAFTSGKDSEVTIEGNLMEEQHWTQWYYQFASDEIEGVSHDDFMAVENMMGDAVSLMLMPANKKVKSFTIWLEVYDRMLNVANRPQGSNAMEVHGKFKYKD